MTFNEACCQICSVSFNICRIRKVSEPQDAAFTPSRIDSFIHLSQDTIVDDYCGLEKWGDKGGIGNQETGIRRCMALFRQGQQHIVASPICREASKRREENNEDDGPSEPDKDDNFSNLDYNPHPASKHFHSKAKSKSIISNTLEAKVIPINRWRYLSESNQLPRCPRCHEMLEWEHIAGTWCRTTRGYSGHRITFEEMRLCNVAQCLMLKDHENWSSDEDDEPFERDGQFFLTGVATGMPQRGVFYSSFKPIRHGRDVARADNFFHDEDNSELYGMPFHPYCLEVYKRASLKRLGYVDIEGLTSWWILEGIHTDWLAFPRNLDARGGRGPEWRHNSGDEYLAANPCFVADLEELFQAVTVTDCGNSEQKPTDQTHKTSIGKPMSDKFSQLPVEIVLNLLGYLSFDDIGCLRQVSSTFRRVPQSHFRNTILSENQWLWEAWCDLHYSHWSATTMWEEERQERDGAHAREREIAALTISHDKIDWCSLKVLLEKGLQTDRLKGLRNRARIFKDCNEILDRIERYRKDGKILPGVVPDFRETIERGWD